MYNIQNILNVATLILRLSAYLTELRPFLVWLRYWFPLDNFKCQHCIHLNERRVKHCEDKVVALSVQNPFSEPMGQTLCK